MCGDQNDRNSRLMLADARDYLQPGDVRSAEIDDTKTKMSLSALIDSVPAISAKDHLVTVLLKHKFERVAYRRLVVNNDDA